MFRPASFLSASALMILGQVPLAPLALTDLGGVGAAWAQENGGGSDDGGGGNGGGSDDGGGRAGNGGGSEDDQTRTQRQRRAEARSAPAPTAAERELVVADLSPEAIDILIAEGFSVLRQDDLAALGRTVTRLRVPDGRDPDEMRDRVRALPGGEDADLNHFYRPEEGGAEACRDENCGERRLVNWPGGMPCAAVVPIGMIDTGVNDGHDILAGARIDLTRLGDEALDPATAVHGTAIASLLVGNPDSRVPGLVAGAELVAVDVFSQESGDERADVFSLVAGIDLLLERGVRVVNLSLAGPENAVLREVLDTVGAQDRTVLIAAVGNGGPDAPPAWPAAHPDVLAVTAVDARGRVYRGAQRGAHVDLAAPGVDLLAATSIRGARGKSGTSYAAPFVTAAAALVLARTPELGARDVAAALKASARDLGAEGADEVFGAGLLDAGGLCAERSSPVE